MGKQLKKYVKARAKARKKEAKYFKSERKSSAVKFAESIRGILYVILSVSLVIAVLLSNQGYIVTLEDIFGGLAGGAIGGLVIITIAVALFIYGLKHLRAIR